MVDKANKINDKIEKDKIIRVYGVLGVRSIMSNWNAGFDGYLKRTSNGEIFGSDKSFKMPMKYLWDKQGEKVLSLKSMKLEEGKKGETKLRPRSLKERYEYLFDIDDLKKEKDLKKLLTNLFSTIDVKNFGVTFAESDFNIGITGAVQIGQGFNKYEGTSDFAQSILSPFRDPTNKSGGKASKEDDGTGESISKEAKSTTIGTKIICDEAHYFYPFSINPVTYNEYIKMGVTEGYTKEDYEKFKEMALVNATAFNTNSKLGCENELGIFIELSTEIYLANLTEYIEFMKEDDKNLIVLGFGEILNEIEENIDNIEIYYNPYTTNIEVDLSKELLNKTKFLDIITKKEVE